MEGVDGGLDAVLPLHCAGELSGRADGVRGKAELDGLDQLLGCEGAVGDGVWSCAGFCYDGAPERLAMGGSVSDNATQMV